MSLVGFRWREIGIVPDTSCIRLFSRVSLRTRESGGFSAVWLWRVRAVPLHRPAASTGGQAGTAAARVEQPSYQRFVQQFTMDAGSNQLNVTLTCGLVVLKVSRWGGKKLNKKNSSLGLDSAFHKTQGRFTEVNGGQTSPARKAATAS